MLRFLSPEWFARFAEKLAAVQPEAGVPPLALGQVVTGTPDGTVSYSILVSGTKAELVVGSTAPAAVTLVEDWPTARAIAGGTPVSELLAAGQITLRGDANTLLAGQRHLETLGRALGALEAETTI